MWCGGHNKVAVMAAGVAFPSFSFLKTTACAAKALVCYIGIGNLF